MGVSDRRRTVGTVPVRSIVAGVTALLLLGFGSACGSSPEPAPLDDDSGTDSVAEEDNDPTPTPTEDDSPSATPTPVDVCGLVGPERVQQLFERKQPPKVQRPKSDEIAGAIPGVGTAYHCTYRWAPGQTEELVRVSLMLDITAEPDPKALVGNSMGPEHEPLQDAGDAAGIDRSESYGHGLAVVLAGKQVDDTLSAVLIRGPLKSDSKAFAELANDFFENAPTS